MTQEGPDIALAEEETPFLSLSHHDTLADNLANRGLDARAEEDAAVAMEGKTMSQGGEGEQSRMAGGGAGQHTTGASKTSGAMSSGGPVTWTRTSQGTPRCSLSRSASKEVPHCWAERGRTNVNNATSTSGTPARLGHRQYHSQRDAKGQVQTSRDGAWVRREQSRGSWDPPAHLQEAPIRRYSGYPQPFPSSAGRQNARAMLLGRKSPTAVPHWMDRST